MTHVGEKNRIQSSIKCLIAEEIVARLDEWCESCAPGIPNLVAQFGEQKLLGLGLDYAGGCQSSDPLDALILAKQVGRLKCLTLSNLLAVQGFHALAPLAHFSGERVRREFLIPAALGEAVAARQVVEADGRRAHAIRRADSIAVNAQGLRVPNAEHADWICFECVIRPETGDVSKMTPGFVVVPTDTPGVCVVHQRLPGGRSTARVNVSHARLPSAFLFQADSLDQDQELRRWDRLVAGSFYLSRCREVLAVAGDCIRSRQVSPARAARAWLGAARLSELHCQAVAARALLDQAAGVSDPSVAWDLATRARYQIADLSGSVSRACFLWWKDRSGRRAHPMLQLCDDMIEAPLDGCTPGALLSEISKSLGCDLRVSQTLGSGAVLASRTRAKH